MAASSAERAATAGTFGSADFERTQVGGIARESLINCRDAISSVHGLAARPETEVQVHCMIDLVALGRVGQLHSFEDV